LSESLDFIPDEGVVEPETVDIFDIDLFDNDASTIAYLQSMGKRVICYFSAGTSETWRPDYDKFNKTLIGAKLPEWPGENWLDIRIDDIGKIMRSRIRFAARKGCDAVDPDNMGM
jgi:hypothetical protein